MYILFQVFFHFAVAVAAVEEDADADDVERGLRRDAGGARHQGGWLRVVGKLRQSAATTVQ